MRGVEIYSPFIRGDCMYVEPNSTVRLCENVPLDPDYTDTLWFENSTAQYNYFVGKSNAATVFENLSYVRKERGVIRVQSPISNIRNCNYMMFRNTSHMNKWFYAFVTRIDYVNELTCAVYFLLDPLQTYFFEYTSDQCMIERAHSLTDSIGDNIVPDITNGGEYVMNDYMDLYSALGDTSIVVQWVNPNTNTGWLYDKTFGAAELLCFNSSEYAQVQQFIDSQAQHPDSIQGIYMCPTVCVRGVHGGARLPSYTSPFSITLSRGEVVIGNSLDGYVPKNNKMYTYPYNFFHIDEPGGSSLDLRYEFFKTASQGADVRYKITGNSAFPVELTLIPVGYKGSGANNEYRSERLTIKGFPMCSYATDAYAAWVAQNSVPLITKGIGTMLQAGMAGATPIAKGAGKMAAADAAQNFAGGVGAAGLAAATLGGGSVAAGAALAGAVVLGGVLDVVSQGFQASIAADITKGSFSVGNNDFSAGRMTFWGGRMSLNASDAKIIDDFFTMYGYAVRKYGTPPRHRRQRFTYVKTVGANVHGALPADDAQTIADIYNNGIRFWADTTNVGNYALGNALL